MPRLFFRLVLRPAYCHQDPLENPNCFSTSFFLEKSEKSDFPPQIRPKSPLNTYNGGAVQLRPPSEVHSQNLGRSKLEPTLFGPTASRTSPEESGARPPHSKLLSAHLKRKPTREPEARLLSLTPKICPQNPHPGAAQAPYVIRAFMLELLVLPPGVEPGSSVPETDVLSIELQEPEGFWQLPKSWWVRRRKVLTIRKSREGLSPHVVGCRDRSTLIRRDWSPRQARACWTRLSNMPGSGQRSNRGATQSYTSMHPARRPLVAPGLTKAQPKLPRVP